MTAPLGIYSANTKPVSVMASPLPNMSATVRSYFRPMKLVRVQKTVGGFEVAEERVELDCQGTIQPFSARELKLKAEGQRSWNWQMLHTTPDVDMKNDEEFIYRGTRYRVMSQSGYSDFGYISYELVQDYNERTN